MLIARNVEKNKDSKSTSTSSTYRGRLLTFGVPENFSTHMYIFSYIIFAYGKYLSIYGFKSYFSHLTLHYKHFHMSTKIIL